MLEIYLRTWRVNRSITRIFSFLKDRINKEAKNKIEND